MEQSSGAFPPSRIEVRGACVHNLKNVDVDIPLNKLVGIAVGTSDQERLNAFKRDLYQDIADRKRLFEAETGLAIKDVELVFVNVSTVDQVNQYLLNEINVTLGDSDDM